MYNIIMPLKPSAPPLEQVKDEEVFYNCEQGCDVEFLVGRGDQEKMRIPVHSTKIERYPVFRAMLSHNFSFTMDEETVGGNLRRIPVDDMDGKAFDNLMKFIYQKRISLNSYDTAIETLKAAHKYLVLDLVRDCIKHLYKMISVNNVLYIFAHLRYLCNDIENLDELMNQSTVKSPTPPRRPSKDQHFSAGLEMRDLCLWLLHQTLIFIDNHAKQVLDQDEFENLDGEYVTLLLKRDTLDCPETAVFSALIRWAETECKRQHLPLTFESKRSVLHDLIYSVRFFRMSQLEFLTGPADSGILTPSEIELISNVLSFGQPFPHAKRRLSMNCCPTAKLIQLQMRQSLDVNSTKMLEVNTLLSHLKYMSRPRIPSNSGNENPPCKLIGKNGRGSRKGSKALLKFKNVGSIIKRYSLPCASDNQEKLTSKKVLKNMHDLQEKNLNAKPGKKDESKATRVFYFMLQAFAFFFD